VEEEKSLMIDVMPKKANPVRAWVLTSLRVAKLSKLRADPMSPRMVMIMAIRMIGLQP